jgi:hypothetical protein
VPTMPLEVTSHPLAAAVKNHASDRSCRRCCNKHSSEPSLPVHPHTNQWQRLLCVRVILST